MPAITGPDARPTGGFGTVDGVVRGTVSGDVNVELVGGDGFAGPSAILGLGLFVPEDEPEPVFVTKYVPPAAAHKQTPPIATALPSTKSPHPSLA